MTRFILTIKEDLAKKLFINVKGARASLSAFRTLQPFFLKCFIASESASAVTITLIREGNALKDTHFQMKK